MFSDNNGNKMIIGSKFTFTGAKDKGGVITRAVPYATNAFWYDPLPIGNSPERNTIGENVHRVYNYKPGVSDTSFTVTKDLGDIMRRDATIKQTNSKETKMLKVIEETYPNSTKNANLVEMYFGHLVTNFLLELVIKYNSKEVLAEAKRLQAEADKREKQ